MKTIYSLLALLLAFSPVFSQCPIVNITLATQAQVDNFSTTYPGCTAPTKSISIDGSGINSLTGLSSIVTIGGKLAINNTSLTNLTGLGNLTAITGGFSLHNNSSLGSFSGAANLQTIGGVLTTFMTPVTSMSGLSGLTSVGSLDMSYSLLTDFSGLENLTSMSFLELVFNDELTSLKGLENVAISPALDDFYIFSNSKLSDCAIKYICGTTPDRPGTIGSELGANATGCNSQAEVSAACQESGLPVTLVLFEAKKNDQNGIALHWTTSSETNSKYFQIERSTDSKNWLLLDKMMAQGESNFAHAYSFSDANPSAGTNFYRLKMVDLDETFTYSKIVKVSVADAMSVGIYPNPVYDRFELGANDLQNLQQIQIHNLAGKVVYQSWSADKKEIDVKHFPAGQYVVSLRKKDGQAFNYKLIKQ